jgi:hypothetical protein
MRGHQASKMRRQLKKFACASVATMQRPEFAEHWLCLPNCSRCGVELPEALNQIANYMMMKCADGWELAKRYVQDAQNSSLHWFD